MRLPDPAVELTARPGAGRCVRTERPVRLADVSPRGRLRLDALARYLQDVAGDDADEGRDDDRVEGPGDTTWVVRRTMVRYEQAPVFRERLVLRTWCAGFGSRWAERRTSLDGHRGARVEAVSLWVHVDLASGRPARLPPAFHERWAGATGGRRVSARLSLPDRPPAGATRMPWPLRVTDFDVLDHVNNAAYWEPVEEVLATRHLGGRFEAEIEYAGGIGRGPALDVLVADGDGGFDLWLVTGTEVAGAARVSAVSEPGQVSR